MTQPSEPTSPASSDGAAVGLPPGMRFRCDGCGNLTRFDVVVSERVHRYWHVSVSGAGQVDEADVMDQQVESITCRWCGSPDRVTTERAPLSTAE